MSAVRTSVSVNSRSMALTMAAAARPCTGSNIEGNWRSGLMLAPGAMAMVPVVAGPRSDRMSPKRLEPTITSNQVGLRTRCAARISMWNWLVLTWGYSLAMAAKRSSQYGIEIEMPFDFVAEATSLRLRV